MNYEELTTEEKAAIASLEELAETWPRSLWLLASSGELEVMKSDEYGNTVYIWGCPDMGMKVSKTVFLPVESKEEEYNE